MNDNANKLHPIARITFFLANLSPESVKALGDSYHEQIEFRDPINEGRGLSELQIIFDDLFKQLKDISIDVTESRGDEKAAFLKWVMRYRFRGKERELPGVSYFQFGADGRVCAQEDFWDPALGVYSEFPGVGALLRCLKKVVRVCP